MKLAALAVIGALIAAPAFAQGPAAGASAQAVSSKTAEGSGVVQSVDAKAGTITLHHGPIAALKWPAMTMTFKASPEVLKTARTGQKVKFTLDTAADNQVIALAPN
ncbi:copper-binding protein [Phenylobacterium sp.]|uniref:copper-binding protein n=1 Tax=Phenylobacterium sp. TaxID=1871053 RepID=UPI003562421E